MKAYITLELNVHSGDYTFCPSAPDRCWGCELAVTRLHEELTAWIDSLDGSLEIVSLNVRDNAPKGGG